MLHTYEKDTDQEVLPESSIDGKVNFHGNGQHIVRYAQTQLHVVPHVCTKFRELPSSAFWELDRTQYRSGTNSKINKVPKLRFVCPNNRENRKKAMQINRDSMKLKYGI